MLWRIRSGTSTWRYLVAAKLRARSSVALVAPEGFIVARWHSGDVPTVVRGEWVSPMDDLRLKVLHGRALTLDVEAEQRLAEQRCARLGLRLSTAD